MVAEKPTVEHGLKKRIDGGVEHIPAHSRREGLHAITPVRQVLLYWLIMRPLVEPALVSAKLVTTHSWSLFSLRLRMGSAHCTTDTG
jgi:hypothetical protein